jgi:hypothetical protein
VFVIVCMFVVECVCVRGRAITQAVSRCGPGSISGQIMWDLWWTNWYGGRFSPSTSVFPANSHSTNCSIFINRPVIDAI